MVIVQLAGGLGNQFSQYVAGRLLAIKLDTELKLDVSCTRISHEDELRHHANYRLGAFNILENFATLEEIKHVKETGLVSKCPLPNMENFKGDVYMHAQWPRNENYFIDIIDIVRKEFTLKKPFSPTAEKWRKKILSAECSVSMHFRHGDFAYNPSLSDKKDKNRAWFNITPLDYYYTCIEILKHRYSNLTVFVFSDNLQWVKENLRLDVPTEFVNGCETDNEEWLLMSMCKHNINTTSSFSETSVSLNSNPDKKIFSPMASNAEGVKSFINSLTPAKKDALLNTHDWIGVPFDFDNQPKITLRPFFSLLLVVNNDVETIAETLNSILNQDYKYYEVIIIDNASTDGSSEICRQAIAGKKNVTFLKLWTKVKNAKAWNMALKMICGGGYYAVFLKGNDRFLPNALTTLYFKNIYQMCDIIHLFSWLMEDEGGNTVFGDKKCSEQRDIKFMAAKTFIMSTNGQDAVRLLLNRYINSFLSTKIYYRDFLSNNKIKFNEHLADDKAELYFQIECFLKSKYFMYVPDALYVAPASKPPVADKAVQFAPKPPVADKVDAQIVSKFSRYFTAHIDVQLVPKTEGGDFPILFVSDDRAKVWYKAGWTPKGTIAHTINSYTGKLEFIVKTTVDGRINAFFRGLWIPDPKDRSKLIPYWVDYTKLTVNGKVIFDKLTPAWHAKPYTHIIDVKADEEIKIQVEWLPHRSDT